VLATGAAVSDILEYVAYTPFEVASQTFTGTTTADVLTTTGRLTLPTNTYHYSSDGKSRLYYYDNGDTLFRTADDFLFRNNTNTTIAQLSDTGLLTVTGNIATAGSVTATGGVYLGGTGSANKLDDYEEGTWTPTLNGGFTVTTLNRAAYTKIGRNVHIQLDMSFNGTGTSADLQIDGLPFTNATGGWATGSGYFEYVNNNYYAGPMPLVVSAAASLRWQINPSAATGGNMPANNVDAGYMQVSVTYQVA
jgi:hypothetical protein